MDKTILKHRLDHIRKFVCLLLFVVVVVVVFWGGSFLVSIQELPYLLVRNRDIVLSWALSKRGNNRTHARTILSSESVVDDYSFSFPPYDEFCAVFLVAIRRNTVDRNTAITVCHAHFG